MKKGSPERLAEEKKIDDLRKMAANRFAIGSKLTSHKFERWVREANTDLNRNVRYIHNKFMLIDPLGDDPIVVAGSANFSAASSTKNDENMLIVRGNKRAADVYLGEFMRLYSHHAFREFLESGKTTGNLAHLRTDDWWRDYFGSTTRARQKELFAG